MESQESPGKDIIDLPYSACYPVEFPDSMIDCSLSNPNICARCPALGKFITGGILKEFGTGHAVSMAIWIFTIIVGTFGGFANSLIIIIMRDQKSKRSFDILLTALAFFDLIAGVTAILASTSSAMLLENWSRDFITQFISYYGTVLCYFARSGSTFITVLIAVERYLVIAYPLKSIRWLTPRKTKFWTGFAIGLAAFIAIPRLASFYIVENDFGRDIPSIKDWDYIAAETSFQTIWFKITLGLMSAVDFWLPLPVLLIFNVLVYIEIRKSVRRRKQLNVNEQKEIKAIKMFVPVVIVVFLSNMEPYAHFYYIIAEKTLAREHCFGVVLSIAVNAAVNLPIYYMRGGFRREIKTLFSSCFCCKSTTSIIEESGESEGKVSGDSQGSGTSSLTARQSEDDERCHKGQSGRGNQLV